VKVEGSNPFSSAQENYTMLFKIYEEMRDKYGFNEGATVPEGIEKVRKKIIDLINKELNGSLIKAYPYDRMGIHNWCLIEFRNRRTKKQCGTPTLQVQRALSKAEEDGWSISTKITMKKV
jgi:hypothetical protein